METLESSRLCRLCGKYTPDLAFDIFDEKENNAQKINTILPISVHEMDFLPKYMCFSCSYKLTEFYKFYNQCLQADEELKSQLSWMPPRDSEEMKTTGGTPMVEIRKYKMKDGLDFDVNKGPHKITIKEKKKPSLSNHLVYANGALCTCETECTQDQVNLNNNEISEKLIDETTVRSKRRCTVLLDDHVKENNMDNTSFVRKLRSQKSENSSHAESTTLSTIPVLNSQINTVWDSKLFSDVEVKLEKINVENVKLCMDSYAKDRTAIWKTRESENYDENFIEWRPCKRKTIDT